MRILYHHRTAGDGAEGIHIQEVIGALRSLGHEVRVVALVGERPAANDHNSDSISGDKAVADSQWAKLGRFLPGVLYEVAEIAYNVVGARMVRRAIRDFKPDLVYDRYNTFCTAAVESARRVGVPVFVEVNAPLAYERSAYERRPLRLQKLAAWYERRICHRADHLIAVSTPLRDFLVAERGVSSKHISVLPNGADPLKFSPVQSAQSCRQALGLAGKTVLGFVGILRPWHGLDLLVDTFCELVPRWPNLHLLIIGDGVIESSLKLRAAELGIQDQMTFTGRLPHDKIREYLGAMDIAISPRATFYASPMKILEYMAMGLVTVAPDMSNIRDIICDGENGMLFAPESGSALGQVLESLLQSPELRVELGREARRTIVEQRNWKQIAQEIIMLATQGNYNNQCQADTARNRVE